MVAIHFDALATSPQLSALDFDAIRRRHPLPEVAGAIVALKQRGHEWHGRCPFHQDKTPSFTVNDEKGFYHCFGCGAHGDVLDFLQRLHGVTLHDAARMLDSEQVARVPVAMARLARPDMDSAAKVAMARAIWESSLPGAGSPAEAYLRSRGISVPLPPSIRFMNLPYHEGGKPWPCLIAAVQDASGAPTGIQRIYLQPEGRGKAMLSKPKLSLGRVAGGAIRIGEPVDGQSLLVCEGPEDGLSLHQMTGRPVWVAAGASFLPAVRFPPGVRQIVIGADNDPAGREAAHKAAHAYAERGLSVRVIYPPEPHKDFNDELRGAR